MNPRLKNLAWAAAIAALSAACGSYGPQTVPAARFDYNQAIAQSRDEQMLLNLVRMRYRDTPFFLEIGHVTTQYDIDGSLSATPTLVQNNDDVVELGASVSYSETPVVQYLPLQGEDFVKRVSREIDLEILRVLAQSGWSIERLFLCCVEQINRLANFPSASGPTPETLPEPFLDQFEKFEELSRMLRELQVVGALPLAVQGDDEDSDDTSGKGEKEDRRVRLLLEQPEDPEIAEKHQQARDLLEIDANGGEAALRTRSLMGVFFYLSQGVEVPPEHESGGLVTVTTASDGSRFDWLPVKDKLLRIQVAEKPPRDAFIRVYYRGHWFYIADSDLNSKSTFFLLNYLFSLQSSTPSAPTNLLISF